MTMTRQILNLKTIVAFIFFLSPHILNIEKFFVLQTQLFASSNVTSTFSCKSYLAMLAKWSFQGREDEQLQNCTLDIQYTVHYRTNDPALILKSSHPNNFLYNLLYSIYVYSLLRGGHVLIFDALSLFLDGLLIVADFLSPASPPPLLSFSKRC